MTTKNTAPVPPAKATKASIKTKVISVSADQFLAYMNRMTTALETVERIGRTTPLIPVQEVPYDPIDTDRPKGFAAVAKTLDLNAMVVSLNGFAQDLAQHSAEIRERLLGSNSSIAPPDGMVASQGVLKDGVSQTHDLLRKVQKDLNLIQEYLNN